MNALPWAAIILSLGIFASALADMGEWVACAIILASAVHVIVGAALFIQRDKT